MGAAKPVGFCLTLTRPTATARQHLPWGLLPVDYLSHVRIRLMGSHSWFPVLPDLPPSDALDLRSFATLIPRPAQEPALGPCTRKTLPLATLWGASED